MTYVNEAFYDALARGFSGWESKPLRDLALQDEIQGLLNQEARLLDQRRYEEWLALYAPECLYWIPGGAVSADPRSEVAIAFDDRRRLEDRIYRLGTGSAWSQAPASRTVRLVGNVELFDNLMVRSNLLVSEWRAGETHLWSGWCAHRLVRAAGDLRIAVKQVNLIDRDQNLRNPSLVL
jgi:benzoate/toluate 1,2-dioxygenase beta subunit